MYLLDMDADSFAQTGGQAGLDALLNDLREGQHARAVIGDARQANLAAMYRDAHVIEAAGGVEMKAVVDSTLFMEIGVEYGFDAWDDDEFIADVLKRRPDCRVAAKTGRCVILNQWGQPARREAA